MDGFLELFTVFNSYDNAEALNINIPLYVAGEPLPQLPYLATNIRFRNTEFLEFVNDIILKINNLIVVINQLLPTIYTTSLESPSFAKIEVQRIISSMHDVLVTLEQDILALNKASADLDTHMTYIAEKLNGVNIPSTEITQGMFQEGGSLYYVADDLKALNEGILEYDRYLYRLADFLRELYNK